MCVLDFRVGARVEAPVIESIRLTVTGAVQLAGRGAEGEP